MPRQNQGSRFRRFDEAFEKLLRAFIDDAATLRVPTCNTPLASLHADRRDANVHYKSTTHFLGDATANAVTSAHQRTPLILVDPRELTRGCLTSWLSTLHEFQVIGIPDLDHSLHGDIIHQAGAVIINATAPIFPEEWLDARIKWLFAHVPDLPLVLIGEDNDTRITQMLVDRPHLRGYIPTSCSMELAATTIRLVIAGGTYVPRISDGRRAWTEGPLPMPLESPEPGPPPCASTVNLTNLTPRERAVLDLLQRGKPNKIISHRLCMSQSTVKAHVHNIITKLKVRNRTEAAIAALRLDKSIILFFLFTDVLIAEWV